MTLYKEFQTLTLSVFYNEKQNKTKQLAPKRMGSRTRLFSLNSGLATY